MSRFSPRFTLVKIIVFIVAMLMLFLASRLGQRSAPHVAMEPGQALSLSQGLLVGSTEPLTAYYFEQTQSEEMFSFSTYPKWSLVFFGYTSCPAFCPEMTGKMSRLCDSAKDLNLQGFFISIDPEEDTVEKMKIFLNQYGPNLIGLKTDEDHVHSLAKEVAIYIERAEKKEAHIEHSASWVLIGPGGYFRGILRDDESDLKILLRDLRFALKEVDWDRVSQQPEQKSSLSYHG